MNPIERRLRELEAGARARHSAESHRLIVVFDVETYAETKARVLSDGRPLDDSGAPILVVRFITSLDEIEQHQTEQDES